jgi:hypothetical protein
MKEKWTNAETLRLMIDNYFHQCNLEGKPYTVTGLALYLGTNRQTILNYENKDEFKPIIEWGKLKIHNNWEEMLPSKERATVGVIFNLKNNWGWKNEDKLDMTTGGEKINGFNYIVPKKDDTNNSSDN